MNIKKLRELKKNKKGFTLIEIIVVVVILAVLLAVAVPAVLNYLDEADNAKYISQSRAIMTSTQTELIKAYAPDKKIESSEVSDIMTNVNAGLANDGIVVSEITYYKDATTSDANKLSTIVGQDPASIKAYKATYTYGGKTINATMVLNGSISIDNVETTANGN